MRPTWIATRTIDTAVSTLVTRTQGIWTCMVPRLDQVLSIRRSGMAEVTKRTRAGSVAITSPLSASAAAAAPRSRPRRATQAMVKTRPTARAPMKTRPPVVTGNGHSARTMSGSARARIEGYHGNWATARLSRSIDSPSSLQREGIQTRSLNRTRARPSRNSRPR